jgi:hypothetical protein
LKTTLISPSASGLRCFTLEHENEFQQWLTLYPGKTRSEFRDYFYKKYFNNN